MPSRLPNCRRGNSGGLLVAAIKASYSKNPWESPVSAKARGAREVLPRLQKVRNPGRKTAGAAGTWEMTDRVPTADRGKRRNLEKIQLGVLAGTTRTNRLRSWWIPNSPAAPRTQNSVVWDNKNLPGARTIQNAGRESDQAARP